MLGALHNSFIETFTLSHLFTLHSFSPECDHSKDSHFISFVSTQNTLSAAVALKRAERNKECTYLQVALFLRRSWLEHP